LGPRRGRGEARHLVVPVGPAPLGPVVGASRPRADAEADGREEQPPRFHLSPPDGRSHGRRDGAQCSRKNGAGAVYRPCWRGINKISMREEPGRAAGLVRAGSTRRLAGPRLVIVRRALPEASMGDLAAIWDVDGTLVDTAELHFRAWRAVSAERGRPFTG